MHDQNLLVFGFICLAIMFTYLVCLGINAERGRKALETARNHPERIQRVVFIGSSGESSFLRIDVDGLKQGEVSSSLDEFVHLKSLAPRAAEFLCGTLLDSRSLSAFRNLFSDRGASLLGVAEVIDREPPLRGARPSRALSPELLRV